MVHSYIITRVLYVSLVFCQHLPIGIAFTYKSTEASSVKSASVPKCKELRTGFLSPCHHGTSLLNYAPDDTYSWMISISSVLTGCLLHFYCRWMKKPRCGVPDQIGGATKFSVRKRRYALTGQKWQHKHITYRWVAFRYSRLCWSSLSTLTFLQFP